MGPYPRPEVFVGCMKDSSETRKECLASSSSVHRGGDRVDSKRRSRFQQAVSASFVYRRRQGRSIPTATTGGTSTSALWRTNTTFPHCAHSSSPPARPPAPVLPISTVIPVFHLGGRLPGLYGPWWRSSNGPGQLGVEDRLGRARGRLIHPLVLQRLPLYETRQ